MNQDEIRLLIPSKKYQKKTRHSYTKDILDAIMKYIKGYYADHRYMPSIKEIGQKFGWSTSTVRYFLIQLEEDGRIRRPEGKLARAIVITEE